MDGPFNLGAGNSCGLGEVTVNSKVFTSGTNEAGALGTKSIGVT